MSDNLAEVAGRLTLGLRIKLQRGHLSEDCEFIHDGRLMRADMNRGWVADLGKTGLAVHAAPVLIPEDGLYAQGNWEWVQDSADYLIVWANNARRLRELAEIHSRCSGRKPGDPYLADEAFLAWAVDIEGEEPASPVEAGTFSREELQALAKFVLKAIDVSREGMDWDGGEIQEQATAAGLLDEVQRVTPCGEVCSCAEVAGAGEEVTCYRDSGLTWKLRWAVGEALKQEWRKTLPRGNRGDGS